jgi:hypothetical protein
MSFVSKLKKRIEETKTAVIDAVELAVELADEDVANSRLSICLSCPHLTKPLNQCSQCGCFMNAKTKLKNVSCPIDKW